MARTGEPGQDDGPDRLLLDAIADYAFYLLSAEGFVTSWSEGAQRFHCLSSAEVIGQHHSSLYSDADCAGGVPEQILHAAAQAGRFEGEGWRLRKDGTQFWAHVVVQSIRSGDGVLNGFALILRDLTERKRAEAALVRSEEQFRRLVQGVTDYAIYMIDPTGLVTNWNAGAERIKGYAPDEIIGRSFANFYTEEDRATGEPAKALETARRLGRFEKEGWRVRKDGTRFVAHVVIDAIRDSGGELIGFAKITRDVTERVEAQRQLDAAREQLFQAQKMEAIGQLTGGIAHDFNNLLMAVLGSLEMLGRRLPDNAQMRRLLENAMAGAQRGATLTRRMLAFARRQDLALQPVDVAHLVAGMTELLERSLGPSITVETDFPPELRAAFTDPNQLESALLNLAVNARDAMPNGGRLVISASEVTIDASQHGLPDGLYVRIGVVDSGEGMDEATLSRAAEPFFTTKGLGKGTGLGLSMVHGLAEQSGGRLVLHSNKGVGTRAELWFPAATPGEAQVAHVAEVAFAPPPQSTLTVLAVDDDALILMNTTAMLEEMGHRVLEATSAREALAKLTSEEVDLVVTDHAMPQMTGSQLAEQIKANWPGLPVILATGYAELPPEADTSLPRLSKPFLLRDLAAAVDAAWAGRSASLKRADRRASMALGSKV